MIYDLRFPNHRSEIENQPSEGPTRQIAKDFESVLLTRLFDQVQASLGTWELDEDGTSQQVQGLFWFYLAQEVADKGGLGLWKDIYEHLRQGDGVQNVAGLIGVPNATDRVGGPLDEEL